MEQWANSMSQQTSVTMRTHPSPLKWGSEAWSQEEFGYFTWLHRGAVGYIIWKLVIVLAPPGSCWFKNYWCCTNIVALKNAINLIFLCKKLQQKKNCNNGHDFITREYSLSEGRRGLQAIYNVYKWFMLPSRVPYILGSFTWYINIYQIYPSL